MAEKPLLKDLCRANKGNNSSRRIAELSGVPEATVNGFFARASKDPSVYTVGPICRVCNVSLDEYFGIEIPDKTPENEHRIEVLEHDNAAVKRENELLERSYQQHRRALRAKDRLIYCLTFVAAMAIIALVPYLRLDIIDPRLRPVAGLPVRSRSGRDRCADGRRRRDGVFLRNKPQRAAGEINSRRCPIRAPAILIRRRRG